MSPTASSTEPAFSVVIPLYNKRDMVRRTLQTVLAQRLSPVEVIIVDDGSTDGSAEAIADLVHHPVRVVRQTNAGPGPARNHGVRLASGDWVALIDGDDLWHPEHLRNLAGVIAAFPEVDLVAATARWQPASAVDLAFPDLTDPRPKKLDYFADSNLSSVHTSSVAVRRRAFLATGGFGAFCPGEDVEFWTRFALDHAIAQSPVPTSIYVRENGGIMDNDRSRFAGDMSDGPFEQLIARALADSRYQHRHRDIAAFADDATLGGARNMLYVGNGRGARQALKRLRAANGARARLYGAASYLPGPALRGAAKLYSALKSLLR